jgi:hypothetical protein
MTINTLSGTTRVWERRQGVANKLIKLAQKISRCAFVNIEVPHDSGDDSSVFTNGQRQRIRAPSVDGVDPLQRVNAALPQSVDGLERIDAANKLLVAPDQLAGFLVAGARIPEQKHSADDADGQKEQLLGEITHPSSLR